MKSLLIFGFALISTHAISQSWLWSTPQPVTDSMADNRNAVVTEILMDGSWGNYIFWERSTDATSTAIYYRNLYGPDESRALFDSPGVHYRNPRFIQTSGLDEDTLCYFFYESDESGNSDIFYQVLTLDGFGDPIVLADSPADETHFRCSGSGAMTWQEGGKIRYAELQLWWNHPFTISGTITIDSTDCFFPEVPAGDYYSSPTFVAWLKGDTADAAIWYSYQNWQTGTWSEPQLMTDEGNNTSMRFSMDPCYGATTSGEVLLWENVENGMHTIRMHHMYMGEYMSEFQQSSPFLPVYGNYMVPVESDYFYGFMAFILSSEGNGDIFVNEFEEPLPDQLDGFINLSGSPYEDTHPDFFIGHCHEYWCDQVLTWESLHSGHWQIWYSTAELMCAGAIDEYGKENELELSVYPNPCRETCCIDYHVSADTYITLQLYDLDGKQYILFENKFHIKGDYTYQLDLQNDFPRTGLSGLLIIRLQTPESIITGKVARIK